MDPDSSAPNPRKRVAQLRRGDKVHDIVLLVESANFKQTRNQKYFIQMSLRDATGAIKALCWEATPELYRSFGVDDYLRVSGRVEEFQQQLQLIVDKLERIGPESVNFRDFLPTSERDLEAMERELHKAIEEVRTPEIRELLLRIVMDERIRPALLRCPAGKTLHHAYIGGLLEHIVDLVGCVRRIAEQYPRLNRDVLTAAAILHDIGKVEELSYTRNFSYTDRGQLVGHIGLGLLLLTDKAKDVPGFPQSLLLQLQHIVVSHHGQLEFGALKPPMTAEAIAFHYLDNLDAKLATLNAIEKELPAESESESEQGELDGRWSDFKPHLGRKLFFPKDGR